MRRSDDNYWHRRGYVLEDYPFDDFLTGSLVLDVGCGRGEQMEGAIRKNLRALGVDNSPICLETCRQKGLTGVRAVAENLPFKDGSFDGVICKVVLPLTDEKRAVAELARVLRPGGEITLCVHGIGYYLHYFLFSAQYLMRVYSVLTIMNTWIYRLTGTRWRTTIYQSPRRLAHYFDRRGLQLVRLTPSKRFVGIPVFLYYRLVKRERPGAGNQGSEHGPAACR